MDEISLYDVAGARYGDMAFHHFYGLHVGVVVFGIGAQIADLGVILAVFILRRMERGYDAMLNYDERRQLAGASAAKANAV